MLATAGTALALGVAGCSSSDAATDATPPTEDGPDGSPEQSAQATPADVDGEFASVYESVADSVVQIRVSTPEGTGQGAGYLYGPDRLVTNEHVVAGADRVWIRFRESGWLDARVEAADVYSDLATLRPESVPESATPLPLAEGSAQVGQEVVAIGNPLGFSGSVTSGIVSGVDRARPSPTGFQIPDAIQTDAPVNPGNSGGPLVSLDGTVLGVINSGGGDNIGFAISAALMSRVVPALARSGSYDHPYMGVALTNVTPLIAEANDLDPASGVYIDAVRGGGPTDGVLEGSTGETTVGGRRVPTGGDVVDALAGEQTPTTQGLASALALETTPGEPTDITFRRDGRRQSRTFRVGTRPEA